MSEGLKTPIVQLMRRFPHLVLNLLPLLAGPIFLRPPLEQERIVLEWLHHLALLLLVFGAARLLAGLLIHFYGEETGTEGNLAPRVGRYRRRSFVQSWRDILQVLVLILCALPLFAGLQLLHARLPSSIFYLVLAGLALMGTTLRLSRTARVVPWTGARFLFNTLVAYLSLQLTTGAWLWQPALVAVSFAAALAAVDIAVLLKSSRGDKRLLSRLYGLALLGAPLALGLLVSLGQLSPAYLATLALPAGAYRFTAALQRAEQSPEVPARLVPGTVLLGWLFVVIVFLVGVI